MNDWAEEIHAEHHPGYIVPSLDSCPEHTRAEYERLAADLCPDCGQAAIGPFCPQHTPGALESGPDCEPGGAA